MLSSSDPVASIIPAMSLESTSDNAMTALSRLALGPVHTDHYLAIFERFDDAGRTRTTWNWAACLFTLNWMVFRQLWGAALVYVAAAEGLALLVFGLGRSFLQWPQGVEWGVLGAVALMAFAVPGLYGDAILYTDIRKRVARALAASRTVPEACVLLEKQASSRKRLQGLVLINMVLAAAAGLIYLMLPPAGVKPLALEPAVTVADAKRASLSAAAAASAIKASAALETSAPAAPQAAPATPEVQTKEAVPEAAETAPTPTPTPAPRPEPPAPPQPPNAHKSATNKQSSATAGGADSITHTAPEAAIKASGTTVQRHAGANRPAASAKNKVPAPTASAASAASVAQPAGATVGTASGYYINVGLFADEANARKAQARLLNEGIPAFRQELNNAKGRRIRVRVGPYDSRAAADAAAASIRAMELDAVVFKQ